PNRTDSTKFPILDGGAVRLDNADLITSDVTFFHNTATDNGGAVALVATLKFAGNSIFNGTTFNDNFAGLGGGAVAVNEDSGATIYMTFSFNDTTFDANVSLTGGGAASGEPVEYDLVRVKVTNNEGAVGGISGSIVHADKVVLDGL